MLTAQWQPDGDFLDVLFVFEDGEHVATLYPYGQQSVLVMSTVDFEGSETRHEHDEPNGFGNLKTTYQRMRYPVVIPDRGAAQTREACQRIFHFDPGLPS